MIVANATDLITKKKETVIIHRQRVADIVINSLDEWNKNAISPSINKPYNKETQEAIQEAISGKGEIINNPSEFFNNL
jgi:hypothetical protein